jgi:hypothetical protein
MPSGGGAGGGGGGFDFMGAAGLGLGAAGTYLDFLDRKKAKKALKAREARALNYADLGASAAKTSATRIAENAQGQATQNMIDRGFYNSTVATDAGAAIAADKAQTFGQIDQRLGQQKADITMGFAESAGDTGGGYQALSEGLRAYMASKDAGSGTGTNAAANTQSPVTIPGGNPEISSSTFQSPFAGGDANGQLETAQYPTSAFSYATAVRRKNANRRIASGGSMF